MSEKAINVLLIEGDADESSIIKNSLTEHPDAGGAFAVKEASRLSTGSRLLAQERFDAIILDLSLPQNVGIEGFRKVRAQTPETPILILTGLQDEAVAVAALREGAQDYVVKGTPECCLLKRAVRHAMERQRLTREVERLEADAAAKRALDGPVDHGRLRRLEDEARENLRIAEIKGQFMGRISHELRNTLATVKTAVFCLNDGLSGPLTPRQTRLVEMISRNVDRQVKIIDNILDLARFQSGKIKIDARPVELSRIIDEISQEFRMKNKAQRLLLDLPDELPAVNGDADLLVQVLRNLLDNALRFARSRVTIKAAVAGPEEVVLSVIDDGAGIPKNRIGELFNQFVQLDRPKSGDGYKGTGLGLAICKEIIEGHRGRVWVESTEGEGASFHFALPKCGAAEPAILVPDGAAEVSLRPSHRVQK